MNDLSPSGIDRPVGSRKRNYLNHTDMGKIFQNCREIADRTHNTPKRGVVCPVGENPPALRRRMEEAKRRNQ